MAKYLLLIVVAACIFSTQVYRPIDHTSLNIWREADVGSIARNFYQEGMDIFYPRIDWRGIGPGYVESEFPLQAWVGALLYSLFGYHEWFLRLISMIFMLGSSVIFFFLARLLLSEKGAFLASCLFVFHPLIFMMATAIQPEPGMLFAYLLAIYFFVRWIRTDRASFYLIALLAAPLAILLKLPAAHMGILFALLSIDHFGWRAFISPQLWGFAIFSLGIPLFWYEHARNLWIHYGNSLGISNEAYVRMGHTTWKNFFQMNLWGNLVVEVKKVWLGVGCLFLFYLKDKTLLYWGISLLCYYLISGGTTGDNWASYYHIVSVPFACLVIAEGFFLMRSRLLASSLLLIIFSVEGGYLFYANYLKISPSSVDYRSAKLFKSLIPPNTLIVVNGNGTLDDNGRIQGANIPYYFFWLDQKGFTLYEDLQSIDNLIRLEKLGAKYFVIEKKHMETDPPFYREVFLRNPVVSETDGAYLIKLND